MEHPDLAEELRRAQLEAAVLQNEKLRLDLSRQRDGSWHQTLVQFVPIITAILSIAGFIWGVFLYTGEQKMSRSDRETQSLRQKQIAEHELMTPWLDSQRATYSKALDAAAAFANSRDESDRAIAEQKFWQLYQGQMILVETHAVSGRMKNFGDCLDGTTSCNAAELNTRVRALASAMAESMAETAKMSYEEFARNQFRYTPASTTKTKP
jgi:hypothetical protein